MNIILIEPCFPDNQQEFVRALQAAGASTQAVEGGYMANAWMRLRHPDYDALRHIMNTIGETVKVHAA